MNKTTALITVYAKNRVSPVCQLVVQDWQVLDEVRGLCKLFPRGTWIEVGCDYQSAPWMWVKP